MPAASIPYFVKKKHERHTLFELCITRMHAKSSWYGFSFVFKKTPKVSVFGDSRFTLYT